MFTTSQKLARSLFLHLSPPICHDIKKHWRDGSELCQAQEGAGLVGEGTLKESHWWLVLSPPKCPPLAVKTDRLQRMRQCSKKLVTLFRICDHMYIIIMDIQQRQRGGLFTFACYRWRPFWHCRSRSLSLWNFVNSTCWGWLQFRQSVQLPTPTERKPLPKLPDYYSTDWMIELYSWHNAKYTILANKWTCTSLICKLGQWGSRGSTISIKSLIVHTAH